MHPNNHGKMKTSTTSKLLVAVVTLQGLILLGQWTGSGHVSPAHAQIPDAAGHRQQMIEEIKSLGTKVDAMVELLKSGEVRVRTEAEKK
jgi:hypothetical protein